MSLKRGVSGVQLRYVLTIYLSQHGRASIPELVETLEYYNFEPAGNPAKSISDALRWEIAHGRVRRLRRSVYGTGYIPRSTEHRIRERVLALRAEADVLAGRDWDKWWDAMSR
ncbi:MAG: hypothetical protein ACXWD8_03210 [Mycobacterium sp.]